MRNSPKVLHVCLPLICAAKAMCREHTGRDQSICRGRLELSRKRSEDQSTIRVQPHEPTETSYTSRNWPVNIKKQRLTNNLRDAPAGTIESQTRSTRCSTSAVRSPSEKSARQESKENSKLQLESKLKLPHVRAARESRDRCRAAIHAGVRLSQVHAIEDVLYVHSELQPGTLGQRKIL